MKVGGRRRIVIPPGKAYGRQGAGGVIGPDETLVFVVDLLGVSLSAEAVRAPPGASGSLAHRARTTVLPRPEGHPGRPAARIGPVGGAARRCSREMADRLRLRADPVADVRGPRRVPAPRRGHRRRHQGDVRLRGQGRPPHRPAPRGHRLGGAGLRRAPPDHAVEGLVRHAGLPLRAAPGGAATASTTRWASRPSGRADPDLDVEVIALGAAFLRGPRAAAVAALLNSLGTPADRAAYVAVLRAWLRARAARPRARGRRRRSTATRCGCSTPSARPRRAVLADAPAHGRVPRRRVARPTSSGSRPGCGALGIAFELDAEPRARPRLLHAHHSSSSRATPSAPPSPRSSAAAATTAWSSSSAASPRRASGSAAGIERVLLACDAEGVFPAPGARVDVLRGRHRRRRRRPSTLTQRAARRRHQRRPGLRRPLDEVPDEGGRPQRRPARAHRRRRRAGRRHRRPCATSRTERPDHRSPSTTSSTTSGRHSPRDRAACAPIDAGSCDPSTSAQVVHVCGWVGRRREHGEHLAFVDLRDHTGVVQCVVDGAADLRSEYVVRITGTVRAAARGHRQRRAWPPARSRWGTARSRSSRPPSRRRSRSTTAPTTSTRACASATATSTCAASACSATCASAPRSTRAIRGAMERQGFVEVETPMLMPSTPEGAREFLVPSPAGAGQLLRAAAEPAAVQAAAAWSAASTATTRSPAACATRTCAPTASTSSCSSTPRPASSTQDDVLDVHLRGRARRRRGGHRRAPGRRSTRITWHEAMDRFGVDKPDLRFGMELDRAHRRVRRHRVQGVRTAPGHQGHPGAGRVGRLRPQQARRASPTGPSRSAPRAWCGCEVGDGGALDVAGGQVPVATPSRPRSSAATGAEPGDLLLLVADEWHTTCEVLGTLRNDLGRPPVHEGPYRYVWVVDFPMFVGSGRGRPPQAGPPPVHPPAPRRPRPARVRPDVGAVAWPTTSCSTAGSSARARSGSTSPTCSSASSTCSASTPEEAQRRFGFFLTPFRYGAPPHGGFAFGIDRLVAILAGEENIREVIAFPKTQSGTDPMTKAPDRRSTTRPLADLGLAHPASQGLTQAAD